MPLPSKPHRVLLLAASVACLLITGASRVAHLQSPRGFADRVAQLSESGGSFDTDNLISNEQSYLDVVDALRAPGRAGGAYIGVGPDQNFTYIAHLRPAIAFIVDIRRDNLLLHLLFKALFAESATRVEYLSALFGRVAPARPATWTDASLDLLAQHIDQGRAAPGGADDIRRRMQTAIRNFGVPLSAEDLRKIDAFHRTFIEAGLDLKFNTTGQAPRSYYPTYRDLLLQTAPDGARRNFLASEDDYQFVRRLQQQDLVIPVVGDLAGRSAITAIARLMEERHDRLSAFYTSNVEFYLFRDGTFASFAENLRRIPRDDASLIVRSIFGGPFVQSRPPSRGFGSESSVEPANALLRGYADGRLTSYRALVSGRP